MSLVTCRLFAKIHEQAANSGPGRGLRESEWGPIWMVGHSLGAHISAYASYLIKESQKGQPESWIVGRITGLDPAQPCFSIADESLKLDKDDAPFVDVIHTNARNLLFLGLGLPEQLGFVDFYPNGGKAQPGCVDIDVSIWSFLLLPANRKWALKFFTALHRLELGVSSIVASASDFTFKFGLRRPTGRPAGRYFRLDTEMILSERDDDRDYSHHAPPRRFKLQRH